MSLRLVAWSLVCVIAALLASCGTRPANELPRDANGRILVEFWHAMSGEQAAALNDLVDQFNQSQQTYAVNAVYQGHYNSLQQKLIASLYAGRQPAASQMYGGWATRFLQAGVLQPVDHFIASDADFRDNHLADLEPAFLDDNTYRLARTAEGEYRLDPEAGEPLLATLPFNKSVYVLYVNDTLMHQVGFDKPPADWDELARLAKAMTDRTNPASVRYGFATRPNVEAFTPLLMAAGINHMDEREVEFRFADEPGQAALTYLADLVLGDNASGYVEPSYLSGPFGQGRIGMYIGSTASFPFNDSAVGTKFIWRAYPVPPRTTATEGRTLSQGTNVGVFRRGMPGGSDTPAEVQQGAWQFLRFLASPEPAAEWAIRTGYVPVRRSSRELPTMQAYIEKNVNYSNALATTSSAMSEPRPTWWDSIRMFMDREVDAVLSNGKDPNAALGDALRNARMIQKSAGQ